MPLPTPPPYLDGLLAAFVGGRAGRCLHLGYWPKPTPANVAAAADFAAAQQRLNDRLLALARIEDGLSVLDVGCGLGGTLAAVDARHAGIEMMGLNLDFRQLAMCAGLTPRAGNRLHWLQADACALPLADACVDRVLCIEAMFHFASRRRFFAEAARVLKPGGRLVCSDIVHRADPTTPVGDAELALHRALLGGFAPWPDYWGHDADHRELAAAAGLDCSDWVDATGETLPSHAHTAPAGAAAADAVGRAAHALAQLHRGGRLAYPLMAFTRGGGKTQKN